MSFSSRDAQAICRRFAAHPPSFLLTFERNQRWPKRRERNSKENRVEMHKINQTKPRQMRATRGAKRSREERVAAEALDNRPGRDGKVGVAEDITRKLALKKGAGLTAAESRNILLLYFRAVLDGSSPYTAHTAVTTVRQTYMVGYSKVDQMLKAWNENETLAL